MADFLQFDRLYLESLETSLAEGRTLGEEELRSLCQHYLVREDGPFPIRQECGSFPKVFDAMRSWLRSLACRRFPDAGAERFSWRWIVADFLGRPMVWFRNDQTGLILLYYQPESDELDDPAELLRRCIRAVFPVLDIRDDVTACYLFRHHEVIPCTVPFEPEDAWLQLAVSDIPDPFGIACNVHEQLKIPCRLARWGGSSDAQRPLILLSRVLHSITGADPRDPGGVFIRRQYSLRLTVTHGLDFASEHDPDDYIPLDRLSGESLRILSEGAPLYNAVLPPAGEREQCIEADAGMSFYSLQNEINRVFSWPDVWSSFRLGNLSVTDEDLGAGHTLDHSPNELRTEEDMLLREFFEYGRKCVYCNGVYLCSVELLSVIDTPVQGPETAVLRRQYTIHGGRPLRGRVCLSGSARSAVAVFCAALITRSEVTVRNVPDTEEMRLFLNYLPQIRWCAEYPEGHRRTVRLHPDEHTVTLPRCVLAVDPCLRRVRLSALLMGSFLGSYRWAVWGALPFHAGLGFSPMGSHVEAFEKMGAVSDLFDGTLTLRAKDGLKGSRFRLDQPSALLAANIMLAAVTAEGTTTIENVPDDPLLRDLIPFLCAVGADVRRDGGTVEICGVKRSLLHGTDYTLLPDAEEAGLYLCMAAATAGDVTVENVSPEQLSGMLPLLRDMGAGPCADPCGGLRIAPAKPLRPFSAEITMSGQTGLNTLPQLAACAAAAEGISTFTVHHNGAFTDKTADALRSMGVGVSKEDGDPVRLEIRGSGSLKGAVLSPFTRQMAYGFFAAGLAAEGVTTIDCPRNFIEIHDSFVENLHSLGAEIEVCDLIEDRYGS